MPLIHAQTETAVANEALSHIYQPPIVDIVLDQTHAARVVRKHFAAVRDALQRRYPWNFNAARAKLNAETAKPAFGFAYQYAQPDDCLRVREVDGCNKEDWKVEGRLILTDAPAPLKIIYSRRVPEVNVWDPLFRSAFALSLGAALGEIATDKARVREVAQQAAEALQAAFPVDASEDIPDEMPDGDWLDARI